MGKYLHNFATQALFEEDRNNNYIEPWVSLTKKSDPVVNSMVITPPGEESPTTTLTYIDSWIENNERIYMYCSDVSNTTITNVDTTNDTITCNGMVFDYTDWPVSDNGTYTWETYDEEEDTNVRVTTYSRNPNIGDTAKIWNWDLYFTSRHIKVGDTDEDNSCEVKQILDTEDGDTLNRVDYNKSAQDILLGMPLTFDIQSDGIINLWNISNLQTRGGLFKYKKNNDEWNAYNPNNNAYTQINVSSGDKVQFISDAIQWPASDDPVNWFFSGTTCGFKVKGNIMSLVGGDNFSTCNDDAQFESLFANCSGLTDASKLILPTKCQFYRCMFDNCTSLTKTPILPATELISECYNGMFWGCTSLTTAPELPATTLAQDCYNSMFNDCTSLTTAPKLPATTLANYCYMYMFGGCTSLTTAPELPATTLVQSCYSNMFRGCSNLNYIKCLATDISATDCTYKWVNGVASTGEFVKNSSTSWTSGSNGIPSNWTITNA